MQTTPISNSFYIKLGGDLLQDIYPHQTFPSIQKHAFFGVPNHCTGVSRIVDHLINTFIIPNHPLTNQEERLSNLLDIPQADAAAEAFRHAAQNKGTLQWRIDQCTERLTLTVPYTSSLNLPESTNALSLHQNSTHLTLTIPYNHSRFFSNQTTPLLGDICHNILDQINHALQEPPPEPPPQTPPVKFSGSCPIPPDPQPNHTPQDIEELQRQLQSCQEQLKQTNAIIAELEKVLQDIENAHLPPGASPDDLEEEEHLTTVKEATSLLEVYTRRIEAHQEAIRANKLRIEQLTRFIENFQGQGNQ